ncbi:MAG: nucleoside hydrolase [Planctomycetes bacterium]|nr:nucleoside hydrolase [Planctomycetota bacterium]
MGGWKAPPHCMPPLRSTQQDGIRLRARVLYFVRARRARIERMTRKLVIDCAPGIDDALALMIALLEPELDVVAVTATEGSVPAETANRNVRAIIETVDPLRLPRIGTASTLEDRPHLDLRRIYGDDGLGNAGIPVARLHQEHPSEKILCDEIRAAPGEVTVVCLGPLTNLAGALKREPDLARLVHRIVIAGGTLDGIGDVAPVSELNMYYDPDAARTVFRSPTTKTLLPLCAARKVPLPPDVLNHLPNDSTPAGRLVRHLIPAFFRAFRQHHGLEHLLLHRALTIVAVLHPDWFGTREMAGDVEPCGELTTGATIFDRRQAAAWRANMEVVVDVRAPSVRDFLYATFHRMG